MEGRITPQSILKLGPNEIYTFGANERFINGKGSAKHAMGFGAQYYKGPFCGRTYGICTKDKKIKTLPLDKIALYIDQFIKFAIDNPDLIFLVVPIGTMNAGYSPENIAPMFKNAIPVKNIHLPLCFWDILIPQDTKKCVQIKLM